MHKIIIHQHLAADVSDKEIQKSRSLVKERERLLAEEWPKVQAEIKELTKPVQKATDKYRDTLALLQSDPTLMPEVTKLQKELTIITNQRLSLRINFQSRTNQLNFGIEQINRPVIEKLRGMLRAELNQIYGSVTFQDVSREKVFVDRGEFDGDMKVVGVKTNLPTIAQIIDILTQLLEATREMSTWSLDAILSAVEDAEDKANGLDIMKLTTEVVSNDVFK